MISTTLFGRRLAFALFVLLLPWPARAQAVAQNFDELRLKIKAGDAIYVMDETGRERRGHVLDLSPSALRMSFDGQPGELTESATLRIRQRRPDPLWTGALIGGVAGAGLGVLSATFSEECSHNAGSGACVGPVLSATGICAAIGVGIDAMIQGRKVIYERPAGRSVHLSPMASPGRAGIRVVIALR